MVGVWEGLNLGSIPNDHMPSQKDPKFLLKRGVVQFCRPRYAQDMPRILETIQNITDYGSRQIPTLFFSDADKILPCFFAVANIF